MMGEEKGSQFDAVLFGFACLPQITLKGEKVE